ncbi:ankyrin repeat domain-containing protein [candidate division KSB1 bacterium]|nr:ankyrin repeat domain-containing protein [candidate division KSB1 bacterium]
MSEIYDAAIKGDLLTLSKLLARGVDPNSSQDSITVLHISAGMWDSEMVELLINSGAKVDVADKNGRTPLHFAAMGRGLPAEKSSWELEDTIVNDMCYLVETLRFTLCEYQC